MVPERGAELDRLIDDAEQRSASPLQAYVLDRLDGASGPEWLGGQTLEQAVRSTEMLGMRIQFGASKKPSEMTPDNWGAAGRAGYEVTSRGEPAIRDALHQMQAEFRGVSGKPGCREIFGPFYEALSSTKNRKDAGDITRILREHIFDTMDVAAGQAVLGCVLDERRLHSVQSLASETGLDPRTLRNVLAARGLIPVEQRITGHHVFDAEKGREVAGSVLRLTHVSALRKALGCTRPLADQPLDERLLHAISDGSSTAAGRTWKGVDNREIERFLEALRDAARPVDIVPTGMVPIAKAAEKAKLLSVEIVHLILGGFLDNVARLRDGNDYSAILVDPAEVRAQSHSVLAGMCASAAFGRLKIPKTAGWALVGRREGPGLDPLVITGRTRQHQFYRFSEEAVATFMSQFTTEARLATKYDLERRVVVSHLKNARVRPALDASQIGVSIYRAVDMPELELT
ncbi:hypothetical protein [Palleronia abyssalis]|uniref:Uncharacterized protein n=1 Tax=Palleronia abyssalis TaxID=1501240 RepID=A0A2R8C2A1_9RHOB|nr:hypothetical protein [Palleronia abyssalis]SPJ26436.1 hypothetical protein PAA8504_04296 [Palleronia abyssalis]